MKNSIAIWYLTLLVMGACGLSQALALGGKIGSGEGIGEPRKRNRNRKRKDDFTPGSNGSLAWVSWAEAEKAMAEEKKAVLLYVYDPKPTGSERTLEKRYEINIFKSSLVREAAAKVISVKVPKGFSGLPKNIKGDVGCWLLSYRKDIFRAYRKAPTNANIARDIRFAAAACAQAALKEQQLVAGKVKGLKAK